MFNLRAVIGWALVLLAWVVLTIFLYHKDFKGIVFAQWIEYETAEGEIIESHESYNARGKGLADIDYYFLAEGDVYRSNKINFAGDMRESEHYLQKYPVGQRVTVYYEKGNPDFSVLEPENKAIWALKGVLLTGFFILIYIYYFIMSVIQKSKRV